MSQTFNLAQINEIVKFSVQNSKGKIKLPVALWGVHGIGKTSIIYQVADCMEWTDKNGQIQTGYNVVTLHLATQDVADLIGIPRDLEVKNSRGVVVDKVTIWSCPDWLKKANDLYEETGQPTIFFLDEMNRGNRMVLAAMLPFLIGGTLHTHSIADQSAVVAAMNPATDDYEVNELIDKALLDRLAHVIMKPTHQEYIDYLEKKGVDRVTLAILKEDPTFTKVEDFELGFDVKTSRRSIDYVMQIIGKLPSSWIKQHGHYILRAYLGDTWADAWIEKWNARGRAITIDMLQEYEKYAEEITEILSTSIDGQEAIRRDLLVKAVEQIETYINDRGDSLTVNDAKWMMKFFDCPLVDDEYAASIFQANPTIRSRIEDDEAFNIAIGEFMRAKSIWQEQDVAAWQ